MSSILAKLQTHRLLSFSDLFELKEGRAGAVVSLLAILEMSKERIIEILQEEPLGLLKARPLAITD